MSKQTHGAVSLVALLFALVAGVWMFNTCSTCNEKMGQAGSGLQQAGQEFEKASQELDKASRAAEKALEDLKRGNE